MAANCLVHLGDHPSILDNLRKAKKKEENRFVASTLEANMRYLEVSSIPLPDWKEDITGPNGARRVEVRFCDVYGTRSFIDQNYMPVQLPVTGFVADSFDWPIAGYGDSLIGFPPHLHFTGQHVGEDMGWMRDGCSVYAVANGVVRIIYGGGSNWGFLVAIEHRLPSGRYVSSIYGHGSSEILVRSGERVMKGQKIMTSGLSCSVENGGYLAHIHFGLSWGPIRRPAGYSVGGIIKSDIGDHVLEGRVDDLSYHPNLTNLDGWPQLLAVVRTPDGSVEEIMVSGEEKDLFEQTDWIKGFTPNRAGWISPKDFISARLSTK